MHPVLTSVLLTLLTLIIQTIALTTPGTPCSGETAPILHSNGVLEIFFSGSDGRVYSSTRKPNTAAFSDPGVIGTIRVAPCSPVSAIFSKGDRLDLFVTGDDGPVRTTTRDSSGAFGPWVQLAGGKAQAGTLITPVETSGQVFVFWVGIDGITYETSLLKGNTTANVINKSNIGAGTQVTVIPRFQNPNTVDLFTVSSNQHVYHYNFEAADETGTWTDLSYPSKQAVEAGAPIAAVVLGNGDCHLFIAALDGQIWTSVRSHSPAKPFSAWTLTGKLVVAKSTPILGVKTAANTIELFVTGLDSLVYMSTWNGGFSAWEVVGGVSTVGGAPITGISRSESSFDLFVTGLRKNVSTIQWNVGQSRNCAWYGIGEEQIPCSLKIGEEGSTIKVQTSSISSQAGKKGEYIGIGVAIGLLVGLSIMGGLGFWFYKRWSRKARECEESKVDDVKPYAPAELYCGPPQASELPETSSNSSSR